MPKEITLSALAIRLAAERIAADTGVALRSLSKEERRLSLWEARKQVTKEDRMKAVRRLARKEAELAGLDWKTISKEQRQALMKTARQRR